MNSAPTSGPIAMPRPATIPPIAPPLPLPRSAGSLNWAMTTMVTLIRPPPPMPWTARKAISWPIVWAAPHSAEPTRKVPTAPSSTRLAP